MSNTEIYELKLATQEDKSGILAISNGVYEGYDKLPNCLDQWIKQGTENTGRRLNYVLIEKSTGKVQGYQSFFFQNNGHSFIPQGLRIEPEMKGTGLMKIFRTMVLEDMSQRNLGQAEMVSTISGLTGPVSKFNVVMKRYFNDIETSFEQIRSSLHPNFDSKVMELSWVQLAKLLRDPSNPLGQKVLCNGNYFMFEWTPYHINEVDKLDDLHHVPTSIFYMKDEVHPSLSLVSEPFEVKKGKRVSVDIFADDLATAIIHFTLQLAKLASCSRYQGQVALQSLFNSDWGYEMVNYICNDMKMGYIPDCRKNIGSKPTCLVTLYNYNQPKAKM